MSKEIHAVVFWDSDRKRFFTSMSTSDAVFPDGEVWDDKEEVWNVADYDVLEQVIMALEGLFDLTGEVEIDLTKKESK